MKDLQAVVLAGGSGIRMYPLTETTPKSLLLVNEKPLLWYQLYLLENAGFSEVLVVTVPETHARIQDYITREYDGKIHAAICTVESNCETADALRQIADKLKKDFIVIAGDLVTDLVVQNIVDCHRLNDASVTMLLRPEPAASSGPKGKIVPVKPRRDKDMTDCIGLMGNENRVVMISQAVHLNEDFQTPKTLLKRCSNIVLHTNLYDTHFYVFSYWVIQLLLEKKYISSIKADLIPHLIHRQFRGSHSLTESVKKVIHGTSRKFTTDALQATGVAIDIPGFEHTVGSTDDKDGLIKCCAYIMPKNGYAERADTLNAYKAMDEEVQSKFHITKLSTA